MGTRKCYHESGSVLAIEWRSQSSFCLPEFCIGAVASICEWIQDCEGSVTNDIFFGGLLRKFSAVFIAFPCHYPTQSVVNKHLHKTLIWSCCAGQWSSRSYDALRSIPWLLYRCILWPIQGSPCEQCETKMAKLLKNERRSPVEGQCRDCGDLTGGPHCKLAFLSVPKIVVHGGSQGWNQSGGTLPWCRLTQQDCWHGGQMCTVIKEINKIVVRLESWIGIQHDYDSMTMILKLHNLLLGITKKKSSWIDRLLRGRVKVILFSCKGTAEGHRTKGTRTNTIGCSKRELLRIIGYYHQQRPQLWQDPG